MPSRSSSVGGLTGFRGCRSAEKSRVKTQSGLAMPPTAEMGGGLLTFNALYGREIRQLNWCVETARKATVHPESRTAAPTLRRLPAAPLYLLPRYALRRPKG